MPATILELWAEKNFLMPDKQFQYKASGKPITYEELDLEQAWQTFDIQHELTRKGSRNSRLTIERLFPDLHK